MECHKYKVLNGSIEGSPDRLYIPNKGVLIFDINYPNITAYSFSEGPGALKKAEKIVKGAYKNIYQYLGKIDLPKAKINKFIKSHKARKQTEKTSQDEASSLISLIK